MSFIPPSPIASGKPYTVVDIEDRRPERLEDFVGDRIFTIDTDAGTSRVHGVGRLQGDGVRFVEKDSAASKDVRVWVICGYAGDTFTAEHDGVY